MRILATISAALLFFFLAISTPAFSQEGSDRPAQAQDEKGKDKDKDKDNKVQPKGDERPGKQDDRGMKQDQDKRDEARPNAGQNVPEHPGTSRPEEAARPDRRQDNNNADHDRQQRPVSAQQRGKRIPDDKFRSSFGREHHFHVDRTRVVNVSQPVVVYGGYSFQLVDAWPAEWSYNDDVYIDYVDDGYYMFDAEHPGIRIAVFVAE
jgi:hypothetical protein